MIVRIKLYADIYPGIKPEHVFFSQEPSTYKMEGSRRFEIVINFPDIEEVDETISAHSVEEIENDQ